MFSTFRILGRCADEEVYGYHASREDGGLFTKYGYLSQECRLDEVYRGVQDIPDTQPVSQKENSDGAEAPVMVKDTDLATLLMEMHAVGGDYMRDADYNLKSLANKGDDFLVKMNAGMPVVTPMDLVFRRDTYEHEMWMTADKAPDVSTYIISVTARDESGITGNIFEADLYAMQDYIQENSFSFTHLDAEMKDGTTKLITLEKWDAMDLCDKNGILGWVKYYDPADEAKLGTYLDAIRWVGEENRQSIDAGEFLSKINKNYMARAENPQHNMLRVAQNAAKEILAQNRAYVYRLFKDGADRLSPIDAIKNGLWFSNNREFAIRHGLEGLEKWAKRNAGSILKHKERIEQKSKSCI
jgi:hypothetical protein